MTQTRRREPCLDWMAGDSLGLVAHEAEAEALGVALPDDHVDRLQQLCVVPLFGMGGRIATGVAHVSLWVTLEAILTRTGVDTAQIPAPGHAQNLKVRLVRQSTRV
jgi:hypothetical protein